MGEERWERGLFLYTAAPGPAAGSLLGCYFLLLCSQGIWARATLVEVTVQCNKHSRNTHYVSGPVHSDPELLPV